MFWTIKENDAVYCVMSTESAQTDLNKTCEENLRMFTPKGCKETIMLCGGDLYIANFIESLNLITSEDEKKGINKEFLIRHVIPKLVNESLKAGIGEEKETLEKTCTPLIIASKNKAYYLGHSGTVRELGDCELLRYTGPFVNALMDELSDIEIIDRILIATYFIHEHYFAVKFPIVIKDTKNMENHFYYYKDLMEAVEKHHKGGLN